MLAAIEADSFEEQRDFIPLDIISPPLKNLLPLAKAATQSPPPPKVKQRASTFLGALHEELLNFAARMTPTELEQGIRFRVLERVQAAAQMACPDCHVVVFGSTFTGLALPASDIDLLCKGWGGKDPVSHSQMELFGKTMVKYGVTAEESLDVISSARVPIVKFRDSRTQISVDVCFNQTRALDTAKLVKAMCKKYGAFLPLALFLKFYHHTRSLNETYSGGIGSFMLSCMLVSMFQSHESRSNSRFNKGLFSDCSTGSWLMEFFHYYGYDFNYSKVVISVAFPEGFQSKTTSQFRCHRQPYLVSIINPFERTKDLGRNAFMVIWARQAYRTSYKDLLVAAEAFPEVPSLLLKGGTDHLLVNPTFPILSQLLPPHHLTTVLRRSLSLKLCPNRFFEKLMHSGQKKKRGRSFNSPSIIKKKRLVVERVKWYYDMTPLPAKKKANPVKRTKRRVIKAYSRRKPHRRKVFVG